MKFFILSTRNGQPAFTTHEGMDETIVRELMANLGHSDLQFVSQEEYEQALPPVVI